MRKSVLFVVCLGMIPLWGQQGGDVQVTPTQMICPLDQTEYPAGTQFCPLDGTELVPAPEPVAEEQQLVREPQLHGIPGVGLMLTKGELQQIIRAELGFAIDPIATRTEIARLNRQIVRAEVVKALAPYATQAELAQLIQQEVQRQAAQQKKGAGGGSRPLNAMLIGCAGYLLLALMFS